MNVYKNTYAQRIYDLLAPLVGNMLAKATLKAHCDFLKITIESIQPHHLPILSERIRKALVIFIGDVGAIQIASKIKTM